VIVGNETPERNCKEIVELREYARFQKAGVHRGNSRTVPVGTRVQATRTSDRLRIPVAHSPAAPCLPAPGIP
jgi:hypothetical protein